MKCLTCKEKMECINDVNNVSVRIDWLECPKCKSTAQVEYEVNGEHISIRKVLWER